jgi:hypothetical protein
MQSIFDKQELAKIKENIEKMTTNHEYEILFNTKLNQISYNEFLDLLKYISYRNKVNKLKLESNISLDVVYNYDRVNHKSYRISINDIENINTVMNMIHNRKNHVIFSILISKIINDENKKLKLIRKHKDMDNTFDIDEYGMRAKLSTEENITDKKTLNSLLKLDEKERFNIIFRFKQRKSIILLDDDEYNIRLDLTSVKTNENVNKLESTMKEYEMEIEIVKKKDKTKNVDKVTDLIVKESVIIKKMLQKSYYLLPRSEKNDVLNSYNKLIYPDKTDITNLFTMNPQSIEIQHVVDRIPIKYTVTDKADGDRYNLLIFNNKVYMSSTNLDIKYIGITLKDSNYNGTIIDGEYTYISGKRKYLFLAFDILFYKNKDVRDNASLRERLVMVDDVIAKCFTKYEFKDFTDKYNVDSIVKFHEKEIKRWVDDLNVQLNKKDNIDIIKRKYFIFTFGGHGSEIFAYSKILWDTFVKNPDVKIPYILDGMMYTGEDQKYTKTLKDIKFPTYKWKPPNKNSIDFYVTFERSTTTGQILNIFDDSLDINNTELSDLEQPSIKGKIYQICNLHVGKKIGNVERPTLFQKDKERHIVHLYLQDGHVRDMEGNIIEDNTVVEFYYNDDEQVPERERWIPIRTRLDKTENVLKYKKNYGNYIDIAEKIWRSIQNKFIIDDIYELANFKTYDNHLNVLRNRIDVALIETERVQDIYYQKITRIAEPMRNFHNWIKSNIIYTYCRPKQDIDLKTFKLSVLDVGVGVGGDIMKFFHSRIKYLVGIDQDEHGIFSATNGAISRYKNMKEKFPSFPKMDFLVADVGIPLNYDNQVRNQGSMNDSNKQAIIKYFGKNTNDKIRTKFDVLNCQFMLHYLLKDDITWNNYCKNVDTYLNEGGYLLITTYDADLLHKSFKDGKINAHYTNTDGKKELLFEIIKRYEDNNLNQTGLRIDVHFASFMEENEYKPEYLVSKEFIINELEQKSNLELIETDLFKNIFELNKYFLSDAAKYESVRATKNFFMKVNEYYNIKSSNNEQNTVNEAGYKNSFLNRYYIFKKKEITKEKKGGTNFKNLKKRKNIIDL